MVHQSMGKDEAVKLNNVKNTSITLNSLLNLSKELQLEKYLCVPTRKVYAGKLQGNQKSLRVLSTRDKIVQKAILMLIQITFERQFSEHSHGFRLGKSYHTALQVIAKKGVRTTWFIQLDLATPFGVIRHKPLIKKMRSKISDQKLFDLIQKVLKVWYVNLRDKTNNGFNIKEKVLQGGPLTPLFANIFLDQLDH
jgi:retron-type reverse transcriptase